MRKKGLWKKTASVLIAAAMIMTSVPVYAAGASDEAEDEVVIVQEFMDEAEDEAVEILLEEEGEKEQQNKPEIQEDINTDEEKTGETQQYDYWQDKVSEQPGGFIIDPENKTISISSPEGLAWLGRQINSGTSYANYKIIITENLDMSQYYWSPIDTSTMQYNQKTGEWVTITPNKKLNNAVIEGNGHLIKGLKTNTGIRGANVGSQPGDGQSCFYYSGFIGRNDGNLNINNITFSNADISIQENGVDKAGASSLAVLCGFSSQGTELNFKNVNIENSKVTGYTKVGGFVGQDISKLTLEKCSVIDCIFNLTGYINSKGEFEFPAFSSPISGYVGGDYPTLKGVKISGNQCQVPQSENTKVITQGDRTWYLINYGTNEEPKWYSYYAEHNFIANNSTIEIEGKNYSIFGVDYAPCVSLPSGDIYTLSDAINDARDEVIIKLLQDIYLTNSVVIPENKTVTLDLNGNQITVDKNETTKRSLYAINNYGTFTLKDSSAEQTGTITARGIQNLNSGNMTIESGTIVSCDENGGAAIWNEANLTVNGGVFKTIHEGSSSDKFGPGCLNNGGTAKVTEGSFESVNKRTYAIISTGIIEITPDEGKTVNVAGAHGGLAIDSGTAVVNGGNYSSTDYYGLYVSNDGVGTDPMTAAVIVNGGEFDGESYSVWIGSDSNNPVNSTIDIKGGTFKKPLNAQNNTREGAIVISGGIYSYGDNVKTNVPQYLATGYDLAKIATDTYQVVPKTLDKKDAIESATAVVKNGENLVAEDVTVTIDGYTLKVAGKISSGNQVELTYNCVFVKTDSVVITKSEDGFIANPLKITLEENVEYTVDVSGLGTLPANTILQSAGVKAKVDSSLESNQNATELAEALNSANAVTTTGLAAVASEKITDNGAVVTSSGERITADDWEENLGSEVQLVVSPYLDIQIKAVNTDASGGKQTVTLEIKPMYVVKATTATTAEGIDSNNTVTITEPQPLTVNETVTITLPLPKVFTDATPIYVKHKKENGRTYYYVTTISGAGSSKEISFVNPNGFSDFTLEQDGREGWIDFEGVGIVKYNLSKMGDDLPTPTAPSGKYFINWTIGVGNETYTTNVLNNDLLTAIDGKTLTATPNFGTYPSGPSTPSVTSVTISGISVEDKVYDGKEAAYAGTPSAVTSAGTAVTIAASDYTYTWYNEDGTVLTAAPKDAGEYKLVVGVNNGTYTGSQTVAFKITKKEVVASIDNKTMVQGEALPELTVSYDGFVGTDSKDNALEVQAELTTEADGKTAGEYDITFKTQPTLNNTAGKNYTLKYADKGILKVEEKKVSAPQVLFAKASAGKNSVKLSWNKISGAEGYLIYGSRCGNSFKLLKKVSAKTLSYEKTKLAKGVFYKFYVAAYKTVDGEREVIVKSPQLHVTTKGGKYGNPTAVAVSKESVTVAKGKTTKVTAKVSKTDGKVKYHIAQIRYLSTNKKVATVTSKGTIKGVGKGTCYVYCYTQNGVVKKVKVTVK